MKRIFDLSELKWQVAGFFPHKWRLGKSVEIGEASGADIPAVPVTVPGSVQKALLDAGLIPDWNKGLNARDCEWVENRHWIYEVKIPDAWFREGKIFRLRCLGLDYCGCIRLNGQELYSFDNAHIPHGIDLTSQVAESGNILQIIFTCPPRWLGQCGYTSKMTAWKPRFNYFWDWIIRLVQVGIWDKVFLEAIDDEEIENLKTITDLNREDKTGRLEISGAVQGSDKSRVKVTLADKTAVIRSQEISLPDFRRDGVSWDGLEIQMWWPNGLGDQPLYSLTVELVDRSGKEIDRIERQVGFKHVVWEKCQDAPPEADPWICVVNGKPFFLQGVNWTPVRPNFADVTETQYRKRLELYRDLHMNIVRVWGGGFLGKESFYNLCDELGILVWQEFPLSSSGVENYPPDDEKSIAEQAAIARTYISRRQHHVSLLLWCGGNELADDKDGPKVPYYKPIGMKHPMIKQFNDVVAEMDSTRRFLPTSPSGPRGHGRKEEFGKGVHWDVHGPWKVRGDFADECVRFWEDDDALFRSETGAPGPSPVELIRRYKGACEEVPGTADNPLWKRSGWWTEWPKFIEEEGREPKDLEEYVRWGQARQAKILSQAAKSCKGRFPRCGGLIIWMGHDCFPCTANTSIVDFEGDPKPAALALAEIFST